MLGLHSWRFSRTDALAPMSALPTSAAQRIETHVNAVLIVAKKQVVMEAAEDLEKQVTALGTHLASVPDPDKSEEDFKQYLRAKGTTAEDFVAMKKRPSVAQIKAKKVADDLKVSFACLSSDDPAKWTKLFEQADMYSGFVDDTVDCITALTCLRNPRIRQATGTELRSFFW